jgi:hypothetical protein
MFFGLIQFLGTLLVNAIPLAGVIWFGWSVFEVLFLYWFENVAIGVTHTVRLLISTRTNAAADGKSTASFFAMHYGMFTFVHGIFVVTFFGIVGRGFMELEPGFAGPVLAMVGWQIAFLFIDTLRTEGFKGRLPNDMMFEPYPRVFALHMTVLAGGWLIGELGTPVWALVILVAVKTLFDLGLAVMSATGASNPSQVWSALRTRRD